MSARDYESDPLTDDGSYDNGKVQVMDVEAHPNHDPETTDIRNLTYPPDDLPSEPAVIRSDGALRRWNGYLWRWSESSGWCYVRPL